jgi:hypothetical protein
LRRLEEVDYAKSLVDNSGKKFRQALRKKGSTKDEKK